jgi:hypothetical protein
MVRYKCPRCDYNTTKKSSIKNHYKRKRPCEILHEDITLANCLKLLKYDKKIPVEEQLKIEQEQKQELFETVKILKEQVQLLMKNQNNQGNTNCNNTNSHNNINNVINIHSYKDTDYTVLEKALNSCIKTNGEIDIGKLMEKVHFNSKFPQNHNVYISNSKTRRVMKYDGEKFIEDGMGNTGLEKVFNEKLADIEEHQDLNDDIKIAAEETWMQYNDKDTIQRKEVLETIYKPLYNKRELANKPLIET